MELDLHLTLPPEALADLAQALILWHQRHPTSTVATGPLAPALTPAAAEAIPDFHAAVANLAVLAAMANTYFILDHHTPVATDDIAVWAEWFAQTDRTVAHTVLTEDVEVSTVFLSLNHNVWGEGPPLLFQSMAFRVEPCSFGGRRPLEETGFSARYSTWDEAVAGHDALCAAVRTWLQEHPHAR
jgi:hypothetical protein